MATATGLLNRPDFHRERRLFRLLELVRFFVMNKLAFAYVPSFRRAYADRVEKAPLVHRVAAGAFWSLMGAIISRGLALLCSIIIARFLGKEGFGELGIIQSTIVMLQVFAGFGLGVTTTKYVAELRSKDPDRTGRIISLSMAVAIGTGTMMALTLLAFAPWLAEHTLAAPRLTCLLRISALMLFFVAVSGMQTGALAGFEAFKSIASVNLWAGLFSFPLVIAGVYLGGLEGAGWGLAASAVVNAILGQIALKDQAQRSGVTLVWKDCLTEGKVLWSFSLPAVLSGIMVGPVNWICNAMLVNRANGYAEMGIFNAANQWRTAILFLPTSLGVIVLPILSSLRGRNDNVGYQRVLRLNVLMNGVIALAGAFAVTLSATFIMNTYGDGFEGGCQTLILLALSAVLMAMNNVIGQAIASRGEMWTAFLFNAMWAMAFIGATHYFVTNLGAKGLALATVLAYLLHSVWQGAYIWRKSVGIGVQRSSASTHWPVVEGMKQ